MSEVDEVMAYIHEQTHEQIRARLGEVEADRYLPGFDAGATLDELIAMLRRLLS